MIYKILKGLVALASFQSERSLNFWSFSSSTLPLQDFWNCSSFCSEHSPLLCFININHYWPSAQLPVPLRKLFPGSTISFFVFNDVAGDICFFIWLTTTYEGFEVGEYLCSFVISPVLEECLVCNSTLNKCILFNQQKFEKISCM